MADVLPFTDGELAAIRGRLPDPVAHRARRQAAGLPRLGGDVAASRRRSSTPSARSTSSTTPRSTAARTSSPRRPPTPTRPPARPIAAFVGARADEVVFTKNATEALNLVAYAFSNASPTDGPKDERFVLGAGDEILVTEMEHHANLVPWQELRPAHRRDPALGAGRPTTARLDLDRPRRAAHRAHQGLRVHARLQRARHGQPRRASSPTRAHAVGALVVARRLPVGAAPRRSTSPTLGVDFIAFCGHKMFGPIGVGVLWGRGELLDGHAAVPHRRLDDRDASRWRRSTYAPAPQKFEAGVPDAAQAVGLAAAVRLPRRRSAWTASHAHEHALTERLLDAASPQRPWVRVVGPADRQRPRGRRRVRRRRRARPRRRPGARRPRRRRPGRAPLRVAAAPARSASPRRPGPPSPPTTPPPRSTRCSTALDRVPGDLRRLERWRADGPLPGAHPRALQAPAPRRACASRSTPRCTTSTRPAATR